MLGGNELDPLAGVESPLSLPWVRPTIRRVLSENYLPNTRDTTGSNLDDHIPYSGSIVLPIAVENRVTPSRDCKTGSSSLGSSKGTSKFSHTLQQNEQLPPVGQVPLENPEMTELQAENDDSDGTSTKSAYERVSKPVLEARKRSPKDELASLQDAHQDEVKALKVDHHEQIMVVEAEKEALRERVQELEARRANIEANLEQTNQTPATLIPIGDLEAVQGERDSALIAKRNLTTELVNTQVQAVTLQRQVIELSKALEKSPNEVANISGVVELKDRMFSDLEMRAGECFTALTALEETSAHQKEISSREIASLKAKLEEKENIVAGLLKSKNIFQRQSEEVFEFLLSKVHGYDLMDAMENHFRITLRDNSFLQAEVERRDGEISRRDLKIKSLETAAGEAGRSLEALTKAGNEARLALSAKDIELGALSMELDLLKTDHQSAIELKDGQLANAHWRLRKAYDETVELMAKTRNEREHWIIKSKDDKIAALEKKCQELHLSNRQMDERLHAQVHLSEMNASAANEEEARSADALMELKEAQAQIEILEEQLRGRLGLPASINVGQVLAMKQELDEARWRLQELENHAAESSGADNQYTYDGSYEEGDDYVS